MDILNFFNKKQVYVLNILKQFFIKNNIKAYIVGGAVRDFFLNVKPNDIDICSENDLNTFIYDIPFVKDIIYYEKFNTSTLTFDNDIQIDIIRCRKEEYSKDGALPKVYKSNLYDDLYRRDFTVNSIAYDILDNNIIDLFNGVLDIKNKSIKKIRDNCYKEDPTRIFRAVKYSIRYNFTLNDESSIKNDIKDNVFLTITMDRIMKEIILIAKEEKCFEIIQKCKELNIFDLQDRNDKYFDLFKEKFKIKYKYYQINLFEIYLRLNSQFFKNVFVQNSVINSNLKKEFIKYDNLKEKLLKVKDNYDIFKVLNKVDENLVYALSYDSRLKYKIKAFKLININELNVSANQILEFNIQKNQRFGALFNYINKTRLNTFLKINCLSLINNFKGHDL